LKLLVIDNYDSFTFNLVQYHQIMGVEVDVVRNDEITCEEAGNRGAAAILVSPGPCNPDKAGVSTDILRAHAKTTPTLGVCLGHQSLAAAFGGTIVQAQELMHGKTSQIEHDGQGVFAGLPTPFTATRYHSLAIQRATLPDCFEVSAWTADGEIMGIRHREFPAHGVQFHPESITSEHGMALLENFVRLADPSFTRKR